MLTTLLNKLQPQVELVGLDIGSAAVKLIRLLKDADGYTAVAAVKEDIEPAPKEAKHDAAPITAAVKKCLQRANLSSRNVACGISGPEVMVRGFKFPPLPDQAIEQAVRFEVQQVCPFETKEMILDYQLIENPNVTPEQINSKVMPRNGLMIACTDNVVKARTAVLAEAGCRPMLLDADALAILNCLNELDVLTGANETVAVIDVGWELTNLVIYGQDGLPFVRDLNNAGREIVRQISAELELSEADAHRALLEFQTTDDVQNKILLALNNAVRPLAMAINETLRFYSYQEKTAGVETIFLCGGFSLLNTFVEFFSDALPVEVKILDPFETIKRRADRQGNELLETFGPGMVVATGLAMRTI